MSLSAFFSVNETPRLSSRVHWHVLRHRPWQLPEHSITPAFLPQWHRAHLTDETTHTASSTLSTRMHNFHVEAHHTGRGLACLLTSFDDITCGHAGVFLPFSFTKTNLQIQWKYI
jgi:hypothetical protein